MSKKDKNRNKRRTPISKNIFMFPEFDGYSFSPDGFNIVFSSNKEGIFSLYVMDIKGGKVRKLITNSRPALNPKWSPDGSKMAYVENIEGNFIIKCKFLKTEKKKTISFNEGINDSPIWSSDSRNLIFFHSTAICPPGIWIIRENESKPSPLFLTGRMSGFTEPELIYYKSFDGMKIPAWLYKPRSFNPKETPAVIWVHGGPESQTINGWNPWILFLVTNGYIVLAPNVRGSSGYGRKYRIMTDKDLGGGDLKDIVKAVDFLINTNITDKKKIGILGKSYGGDLTLLALTKFPGKWAAGVSIGGAINWKTAFENSNECVKKYMKDKIGTPKDNSKFYYDRSPINFIKNLKAPVLIIQGKNDPKTPLEQATQAIGSLEKYGKSYEYKLYEDEGHDFRKLDNKIDVFKVIINFFNTYLKVKKE